MKNVVKHRNWLAFALTAAVLVAFIAPVFAATNPFMDVPESHWAYNAMAQLAARGVLSGYPGDAFKGGQLMIRYEIASTLARGLAHVDYDKASKADVEMLKRLVVEFADELSTIGVAVDGLYSRLEVNANVPDAADFRKNLDAAKSASQSVNAFAFDMYRVLAGNGMGDVFFSPYSISAAMAMLYAGATGEAEEEIRDVMRYAPDVHDSANSLRNVLDATALNAPVELLVANAVWPSNKMKLLDEYRQTVKKYYDAELTELDYAEKWREAEDTINRWTEERTRGVIKELIPRDLLIPGASGEAETAFVITNAIYFKSGWKHKFPVSDTKDMPFYKCGGKNPVNVKMMRQRIGEISYFDSPEFQMLRLPYGAINYSMVVILPKDGKTGWVKSTELSSLESGLTYEKFAEYLSQMKNVTVNLYLPKFEAGQNLDVVKNFQHLGLKAIFEYRPDTLDGMHEKDGRLYRVTNILHKTHVSVDEIGTEAAAATAIIGWSFIGAFEFPETVEFRADHPFMFFIMNRGTILFMGRYAGPES
jgi:serpin B